MNLEPQPLVAAQKESWLRWLAEAAHTHRHVGWMPPAHWLDKPPSLYLPSLPGPDGFSACLCASPDRNQTAWLHVFAAEEAPGPEEAWETLWRHSRGILESLAVTDLWVMTTQPWMIRLLKQSGFSEFGRVVALSLAPQKPAPDLDLERRIERMREEDIAEVSELDRAAFTAPWQMDEAAIRETFRRSALATVSRRENRLLGYQMSLQTPSGVHLARLAVHPSEQGRGYGRALTTHLVNYFYHRHSPLLTLNTQGDNPYSFRLYHSLGFRETGEEYPCFRFSLRTAGQPENGVESRP